MQQYQWLLFDADGTLFDFEKAESIALEQTFQTLGVPFEPGYLAAYQRINHVLWHAVEQGTLKPAVVKTRRFEQLLETLGLAQSPEVFSAAYLDSLAACSELITDAAEVVAILRRKYRLAILTNGLQVVQRGRLARSVIRQHIDDLIISEEIGHSKPAREYFDTAFARLGNPPPRETLMIGDGWNSDIAGALQYGIDACWYNPGKQPRPDDGLITREISSLRELVVWLG